MVLPNASRGTSLTSLTPPVPAELSYLPVGAKVQLMLCPASAPSCHIALQAAHPGDVILSSNIGEDCYHVSNSSELKVSPALVLALDDPHS